MSSRAAAGRKRLTGGDKEDKPSLKAPKGFLSRFKTTKAFNSQTDRPLPSGGTQAVGVEIDQFGPPLLAQDVELFATNGNSFGAEDAENHANYSMKIMADALSDGHGQQQTANSYIEASYQPPPPALSSYQSPLPPTSSRPLGHRPLPTVPRTTIEAPGGAADPAPPSYSSSAFPPSPLSAFPTKHPFVVHTSPAISSSGTTSPAPTYTSLAMPTSLQPLPRLRVPGRDLLGKNARIDEYSYGSSPSYPSSSSSSSHPVVLSYSPLSPSPMTSPSDHYSPSEWPQPAITNRIPGTSSPRRPSSVGSGPPKSTSGSSSSSRRALDRTRSSLQEGPNIHESSSVLSHGSAPTSKSSAGSIRSKESNDVRPVVPPSGYVFPVGRSRAQPSKASTIAKNRFDNDKASDASDEKRRNFMRIPLRKKKQKEPLETGTKLDNSVGTTSDPGVVDIRGIQPPIDFDDAVSPSEETFDVSQEDSVEWVPFSRADVRAHPFDPYDPVLLESNLYTTKLLAMINPTSSPTFSNYGNTPPTSVLDLGCGQGHWVIEAALAWRGYGTKVVGFDVADMSHILSAQAMEHGVMENISFVQGNFLEEKLPFDDESFDLVRMSCLTLCIASELWTFVLQEVQRVLMTGGRLELIDDTVVFPYVSTPPSFIYPPTGTRSDPRISLPHLNVNIPSASLSRTSSIYNVFTRSGHSSVSGMSAEDRQKLVLGAVQEEADIDDAQTIHVPESDDLDSGFAQQPGMAAVSNIDPVFWDNGVQSSKNLEGLFDHMLLVRFDIRTNSVDYIPTLLREAFGFGREMYSLNINLASLDAAKGGFRVGLFLGPSTHLPMEPTEVVIHSARYSRLLLSCRDILVEHAMGLVDYEVDERSVLEALKDYERFLPYRLGASSLSDLRNNYTGRLDSTTSNTLEIPGPLSTQDPVGTSSETTSRRASVHVPPPGLTLVRNFRIYEAIKMNEALLTST